MNTVQGRILVIRGGAIGDFILTVPAVAALREHFSNAHLEILGYPYIAQLAQAAGLVDAVRPIEAKGLAAFFAKDGKLDEQVASYFAGFNLILSYLFDPDDDFKTNVALCTDAQIIQCPHRPDETESTHATGLYLKPLEQLAIFDADPVPRLSITGQPCGVPTLALHPGSGSDHKNWPEARWAELIQCLLEKSSHHLLIVGGEAEGERLDRLVAALPVERCTLARSLPLVDLARMLSTCSAFIGHDSGITHIAAALGLPCVVLWGKTNRDVWSPQGNEIVILNEDRGLRALAVERVFDAAVRSL